MSDLANYWVRNGYHIILVTMCAADNPDFYTLDSRVRREWIHVVNPSKSLLGKIRANLDRVFKLRSLFQAERPDAVLSFIDVPNMLSLLASLGLGLRVVISERGSPDPQSKTTNASWAYSLPWYWRLLRRVLYRRASVITALNDDSATRIAKECGAEVRVIPVGIRDLIEVVVDREPLILAVGRLHPVKGFDVLLRAFEALWRAFPNWQLTIVGSGPERSRLVELCEELGISGRVTITDPVRNIETWMARASLVVLPSRSEAFGNALLESMAMGVAVVATKCAGPKSLIDDGVNGRLVPIDDLRALTQAMAELMAQPEYRGRLALEASRVRHTYEQSAIAAEWEKCLFHDCHAIQSKD